MSAPVPPAAPPERASGTEMRRRLLVGLGGLLLMLLLVVLAGYLSGQLREEGDEKAPGEAPTTAGAAPTAPPTEPLGDGAVDPSAVPVVAVPDPALVADGEGGIVVPDLEPDPDLEPATGR